MSKKTPDCFKKLDSDCLSKLENLFESKAEKVPNNNNLGSKNVVKNNPKSIPPPPPPLPPQLPPQLPPPLPLQEQSNPPRNQQENKQDQSLLVYSPPHQMSNYDETFIYNLRNRLPLQKKLEELGEAVLDNHLNNVKCTPNSLQVPEWSIGIFIGIITSTFFNLLYFKIFI
jgi:hypothetical protein